MPAHAIPVTDERSALAAFLGQQQDAFRCVVYGLSDAQAGSHAVTTSELTVGALVKHATQVQESWLRTATAAPAKHVDDRPDETRYAEHRDGFTWHVDDSLPAVLATYDGVSAAVLDAVARLDLDTPVPIPDAPWFPQDIEAWSVRWVWFHLIEELARHAGHADLIREAIDGATMYELIAGREGWPTTPWLTPWQPTVSA